MMTNDSLTSKWRDKIMEGAEGLRTVECLRGRLLAERAASKAANDESEQITKKLIELEKQLKMEIRSRNKAEKRLRFLMKKLDSLNISYVSSDKYSSSISEKSEISSVSSSKSQPDQSSQKDGDEYDVQKKDNNGSRSFGMRDNDVNVERDQGRYHNVDNPMALIVVEEKSITSPRNHEHDDDICDNSMALVAVNSTMKEENKDCPISNGNVKDVLDALRYARECLQTSMDMRRHMKSNIVQHRLDRISC
ncbi:hypothetical protein HanPI659440_Chr14g0565151 [Helianthus annuus]|nr:hypothetical protein HanPI659440_Chr14g0565151 [Helianthus annuus]